jgi:predicted transcriptional regulator
MQILQFTLLASDLVFRGRTYFLAINSNRFGRPHVVDEGITDKDENGKDVRRTRIENGPTRKIFRTYLPELLKEKLLVRIKTNDNRSKYYSITPLGIIHLIKSEMFFDGFKYPHPERNHVILILQTFAQPNVKPYHSIIFENQKFVNLETELLDDIAKWFGSGFREQVPHVFSNVNIVQEYMRSKYPINFFEFFITNGFSDSNKHRLAIFDFKDDMHVNIEELDKGLLNSFHHNDEDKEYSGLNLDDEQFHHYLANLMICSLIYDSAIAHFDHTKLFNNALPKLKKKTPHLTKRDSFREENHGIPEYFLSILLLFSKHISRLSQNQYELTTSFNKELYSMQFTQTKVSNSQLMN